VRHVCRYITAARPGKAKGMSHFILRLAVVTTSVCMIEITGNGCVLLQGRRIAINLGKYLTISSKRYKIDIVTMKTNYELE